MSVEDWSKPIQTVDGRKARLLDELETPAVRDERRVVVVEDLNGYERAYVYFENGQFVHGRNSQNDIINVPPRKVTREVVAWAAVDGGDNELILVTFNKDVADRNAGAFLVVRLTGTYEVEVAE